MTNDELQRIRELCEQATPGPWQWFGNTNHHEVYLATVDRGRVLVMDFVRWGMNGAQPRFQVALNGHDDIGVMRSVGEMAKNEEASKPAVLFGPLYEAPYRKQFTGIGHPDARFIAAARSAVPALLVEVERLRGLLAECKAERDGWEKNCDEWKRACSNRDEHAVVLATQRDLARSELTTLRARCEELEADAKTWSCPDCAFTFCAYHTNTDGSLTCPVCEQHATNEKLATVTAARDELADIANRLAERDPMNATCVVCQRHMLDHAAGCERAYARISSLRKAGES